jgi:hypothetical protein
MNAIFGLTSLIAISTTLVFSPILRGASQAPLSKRTPKIIAALLPKDAVIPNRLPKQIGDPLLLTAWVFLYNQQEEVTLHDGIVLSGRGLSMFALENEVAVTWVSSEICGGSSCAHRYVCTSQACIENYADTEPKVIHLTTELNRNNGKSFSYLVKTLAHELYHLTLPFGPVATSLYEEYWAFYLGTQISAAGWMEFEQYNPLKAICLERWFLVYGLEAYDGTDLYPYGFQAEVDRTSQVCTP